jgi:[ribosomal protein S18]-alanine N-acetyltransferase
MSLRFASPGEAAVLAATHASAFDAGWSAPDIERLMQVMGGFAIAAAGAGDQIEGFILARTIADEGEILTLAVRPEARRRGLGRALVEAAAAEAGRRGAGALLLEVAADNPAALALYQGQGFERVGLRKAYYARPGARRADAFVLRRPLNRAGA